ncbi:LOW QUALITY PROTEIN: transmembrane protease serine 6-like [Pogonomyrmex barbatus]|uniref:LOW QUALITY PROTEIN: transmembrane protease serine 6-like n=1 Tax=Pogonomyrmex barbatus TaxID=144034 RepID=A0A6I9WRY6_9HYME|nr:LOW QUALITY PROTEIN: transmembrane protease serine 6-like [Pogonomyrmex barbatus]
MTHAGIYRFVLFSLLCIFQCCRCLPADFQNITNPAAVGSSEWEARLQHAELHKFLENVPRVSLRNKRLVNLGPGTLSKQVRHSHQACIAPGNRSGHCKHFSGCVLEEFRPNSARFMEYMCIIEQTYIGVCCPDSIATARSEKTFHDDLASTLPAIASLDDDGEEWDETQENKDENGPSTNKANGETDLRKDAISGKQETRKPRRPRGCGTTARTTTRVAGGKPADPKEWPWMVALLRQGAIQYCGGVLITDRHVLTAAHCVYRYKPRDITVRLGEYDFTTSEETRAMDFMVSEIRMHRDFKQNTYENDIAIIKIHRPTVFNSYIWPICLPPIQQSFEHKNAIVIG